MPNIGFLDVKKLKEEGNVKGLLDVAVDVKTMRDISDRAAEALEQIGDKRTGKKLKAFLKSKDRDVVKKAIRALGIIKEKRAAKPLIKLLNDNALKREAAIALGRIGDQSAVNKLISKLDDKTLKRDAAAALGLIGDNRAVQPLVALLDDDSELVLTAAAKALEQIGDQAAIDALAEYEEIIKGYQAHGQLARYTLSQTSLGEPLNLEVTTEKYCVYCKYLRDPNFRDANYPKGVGDCQPQMKDTSFDASCEKWRPNNKVRFWFSKGYMQHNQEGWPSNPWYQVIDDGPDGEKGTH